MIQELKISNFLSFKDEVTFSFEATSDTFSEDYQVVKMSNGVRLLRLAIVYGYNASGKTNLLRALDFVAGFCCASRDSVEEPTGVIPFKLDGISQTKPCRFELLFYAQDTKYSYILELDAKQVFLEKLSIYKSVQPTMLFERKMDHGRSVIQFNTNGGDKISNAAKEQITINCLNNMSVFVARTKVNVSLPLIDAAYRWFVEHTLPMIFPSTKLTSFAQRKTMDDPRLTNDVVAFLQDADFNITNMFTEKSETSTEEGDDKDFNRRKITVFEHTVDRNGTREVYYMPQNEESIGTIRTFGIETAILTAQKGEYFLPIDELETSLHPKLQEKLLFNYLQNHSKSQIIISTHNDGLLDLTDDLIRKDSVWFTDKNDEAVTELFRLTDFRGVNRLSSIREAYRNKRFGATMG